MSRVTYIFGRDPDKKGPPEKPGVPGNRPGKPTDPNEDGPMTLDPPVEEPGPTSQTRTRIPAVRPVGPSAPVSED
jgi:hypothetical protein